MVIILILQPLSISATTATEKAALIIGNSRYKHIQILENPTNDVRDLSSKLKEIGFDVTLLIDADAEIIREASKKFSIQYAGSKINLFYHAGHGVQINGENYIVPADYDSNLDGHSRTSLVNINDLVSRIKSEIKTSLVVVLDACRDNPFSSNPSAAQAGSPRSIQRGLAPIELDKGRNAESQNIMIVFSTSPNSSALDGEGRNSPFAEAFLRHITTPSLDLGLVMRRVTADVEKETRGAQIPWVNASLNSEIILYPLREKKCFSIAGKEYCR